MGIVLELQSKIKELELINEILSNKIKLLENSVSMIYSTIQTPLQSIITPVITKTLDANNIWIGEKGASEYTDFAKLDVHYDNIDDKWRPFECEAGAVPLVDADKIVTLIWDSVNKKFIVYKNPTYAIYYPG